MPDVAGEVLLGEVNAPSVLLEVFSAFGQGLVRHLQVGAVVCQDGLALVGVMVGHALDEELGSAVFQGVRVVLEVRQHLFQLRTVVACLSECLLRDVVAGHQASCQKEDA